VDFLFFQTQKKCHGIVTRAKPRKLSRKMPFFRSPKKSTATPVSFGRFPVGLFDKTMALFVNH